MYFTEVRREDNWVNYKQEESIYSQYPTFRQINASQEQRQANLPSQQKFINKALA